MYVFDGNTAYWVIAYNHFIVGDCGEVWLAEFSYYFLCANYVSCNFCDIALLSFNDLLQGEQGVGVGCKP